MSGFNPNYPSVIGMNTRPYSTRIKTITRETHGVVERIRPDVASGGAGALEIYFDTPSTSSLMSPAIEILSSVTPQVPAVATKQPVSDAGNNYSGLWIGGPGTATAASYANFADFNADAKAELGQSTAGVYSGALNPGVQRQFATKIAPPNLPGMRLYRVRLLMKAEIDVNHSARLYMGFSDSVTGKTISRSETMVGSKFYVLDTVSPPNASDPSPQRPWEIADANKLNTGGGNTFNVYWVVENIGSAAIGADFGQFFFNGIQVEYTYAPDRRLAYAYGIRPTATGWYKVTPTYVGGATYTSDTWYYLHMFLQHSFAQYNVPVLRNFGSQATIVTDTQTDHRHIYEVEGLYPGLIQTIASESLNEQIPFNWLKNTSGAISGIPYTSTPQHEFSETLGLTAGTGYQIASGATPTVIGALRMAAKWFGVTRPDGPLHFDIHQTSATGTVVATGDINPEDYHDLSNWTDVQVPLDTPFTTLASTNYFIVPSAPVVTDGQHWVIGFADVDVAGLFGGAGSSEFLTQRGPATYLNGSPALAMVRVPAAPTFFVFDDAYATQGYMLVDWSSSSTVSDFAAWEVDRREYGDTSWTNLVTVSNPSIKTFNDATAGSGIAYEYRVRQLTTAASSGGNVSDPVTGLSDDWWIGSAIDRGNNMRLYVVENQNSDEWEEEFLDIIDRGRHYDQGTHLGINGSLTAQFFDGFFGLTAREQKLKLLALKNQQETLYLRTPFGDVYQVATGNNSFTHDPGAGAREHAHVSIPYTQIA